MEMALIYDRPSFVELLLENKCLLDSFCTPKRLFFLYNAIKVYFHLNLTSLKKTYFHFKKKKGQRSKKISIYKFV